MTAQESALPRLRYALERDALTNALAAAAELERVGLSEALELVVLLHRRDHARFARAALAWHGRFEREMRASFPETQAVLASRGYGLARLASAGGCPRRAARSAA